MKNQRQRDLEFAEELRRRTGLKNARLCIGAGIAKTVLSKLESGETQELSNASRVALARKWRTEAPRPPGLGEPDAIPYRGPAIAAPPSEGVGNRYQMLMQTDVVMYAGIRAGDVLEFDRSVQPENEDIVVAQIYDRETGEAETVIRQLVNDVLIARCDRLIEPVPVSSGKALIVSVLINQYSFKRWKDAS